MPRWPPFQTKDSRAILADRAVAGAVLAGGIALSVVAWQATKSRIELDARSSFEDATQDIQDSIQSRLTSYIDILYGLQGLFHASPDLSRAAFHRYATSLGLPHRYPQVRSLTFAPVVAHAGREAFVSGVRGDASLDANGNPDFAIRPAGERPIYVPLTFLEPMPLNRSAFGFDLASDAARNATVEQARNTGRVVGSQRVMLEADPGRGIGAVLRLAVYRTGMPLDTISERGLAFVGLIGVTIRIRDVVEDILSNTHSGAIGLQIIDSSAQGLPGADAAEPLFDAASRAGKDFAFERVASLDFGGRPWELRFTAPRAHFGSTGSFLPEITLGVGLVLSALLAGFIYALSTSSRRAIRIADHITKDLRDSEARLAEAQRATQEMIEALPNPIFYKGTDGRYRGVNKAWEAFFGISREAFVGKTVHELYPHDRQAADRLDAMDRVLWAQPGKQTHETTITKPDGTERVTIFFKATYEDMAGKVAGLIGTIVDVTERRQAEEALRRSEIALRAANRQLQLMIESSPLAIYSRDRDGLITNWNPAAERMFGWTREEVLGKPLPTVSGAARSASDAIRERLLADEPPFKVEARRRRRDGTEMYIDAFVSQLRDDEDRITGIITMASDITDRKRAELHQAMEVAVSRVIGESRTLADAIPQVLRRFCETVDWQCGAFWALDPDARLLRCLGTWSIDRDAIRAFVAAGTEQSTANLSHEEGLLRRACTTGRPVWIADVARDEGFRRRDLAAEAGLHAAFAFPLRSASKVIGVMAFFHQDVRHPDESLIRAVHSIGSQMGQFMERMRTEETLNFVATHDGLTKLPNRALFMLRLDHAIVQARRHRRPLAVLFVDLDRFKAINDTLGHDAGDELLREVARRMSSGVRDSDTVARFGGDEFVALLEEIASPAVVRVVAQRLVVALGRSAHVASRELNVTASIGVSVYPADGEDSQALLKNADIAMYRAKERGRNAIQFYSAGQEVNSIERLTLESDLRRALERNELLLHYQPLVDVRRNRLTGFEALVRWQHPERGLVSPADFIPIAEETGLIVPIGEWVLATACATHGAWRQQGLPDVRLSVNLSARQLLNADLLEDFVRIFKQARFTPSSLDLEITESMVMHNPGHAIAFLERVRALGVRVTLDDFGTGYSSLAYLQRLPIGGLKIDRSFIAAVPGQPGSVAITRAVIAMAQSLHLSVVAEGVENREQVDFLRAQGCDEMQGFFFSRPIPENQARALLANPPDWLLPPP